MSVKPGQANRTAERAQVLRAVAFVRLAALPVLVANAVLRQPVSTTLAVALTLMLAIGVAVGLLAGRWSEPWVTTAAWVGVIADFVICLASQMLDAKYAVQVSYAPLIVVAVEAAVLFLWRGAIGFALGMAATFWMPLAIHAAYGTIQAPDRAMSDAVMIVLTGLLLGAITSQSHHRRIDAERAHKEVERLSVTDALTSLLNRRAFELRLSEEVQRSERYGVPLGLLMIDIDHFKHYNDTYGHMGGDEVLVLLGRLLRDGQVLRKSDLAFRFGGEEFAVILPLTNGEGTALMADRIREAVAATLRLRADAGPITVSIGTSALGPMCAGRETLLAQADHALYQAKDSGRNCTVSFEPASTPGREVA